MAMARVLAAWSLIAASAVAEGPVAVPSPGTEPGSARSAGRLESVVVVFKTHFDIGYTDMASNVVQRYRTTMIDDALKVVDESRPMPGDRQFAWTLPGWPLSKIMGDWPGQVPERRDRVRRAFADGRFVVHALPFTMHTELLEAEDIVRGLGYASRLSREVGSPLPRDAKMTDVPSHAWILPTVLRRAGVDFLHLGCNSGSRSPEIPSLFWWEGPDGSRLLTMYTAEGYGTGLVPPAGWPHKTWLALIHTGDNHGPPKPEEVGRLFARAEKELPGVSVRIGRLSDFADAILAEKPELPVVRADMPDTWIHGPISDPAGAALARDVRPKIAAAEILDAQLAAWEGRQPGGIPALAAAWEQSLLYGEHTWGGALYWVTKYGTGVKYPYGEQWRIDRAEGRFKRLEASWAEHTAYIEKARDLTLPILEERLRTLADSTGVDGPRVVVYNPLPWPRGGLVDIAGLPEGIAALRRADGDEVTAVERRGRLASAVVSEVPPLGYATYVPSKAEAASCAGLSADENSCSIESPFYRVVLDLAHGAIRSLIEKRSGRELVDPSAAHGFGRYLYERFDADQVAAYVKAYVKTTAAWAVTEIGKPTMPPAKEAPYRAIGTGPCDLRCERTPLRVIAEMRSRAGGDLPHPVTTRVIVHGKMPCVDVEVTLCDKPADPWPEAGWLCFPFLVDEPRFRVGRQGSVVDPCREFIAGANRHLCGVTSGVAIFDPAGRGVGLCAPDSLLMSFDSPGIMRYTRDFVPKRSSVYVNLFNNQWTTNFRMWNEGTWTARVRIWSFERFENGPALVTPAWEARLPMWGRAAEGGKGGRPLREAGLRLSKDGILVTAFTANPDGEGTLLRLWEQVGRGGPCHVILPGGYHASSAQPCDLRGRATGEPSAIHDGGFEANLHAFAPSSFILR
ncbi:MAG TPA: hypothetical protein PLU30_05235 [Verrucomicrobiae bacterium]|nr:hypothetical protein [Verrucomicrobiae bacterium]